MIVDFLIQLMGPIVEGVQWILDFIWPSAGLYDVDANRVLGFTIPVVVIIPTVLLATILERKRPIENHDTPEARATIHTEWMLVAFMATIGIFLEIALFIAWGAYARGGDEPIKLDADEVRKLRATITELMKD